MVGTLSQRQRVKAKVRVWVSTSFLISSWILSNYSGCEHSSGCCPQLVKDGVKVESQGQGKVNDYVLLE